MGDNSTWSSSSTPTSDSFSSPTPSPTSLIAGNSTTNGTLPAHSSSKGLSNGAVAGVGIGCAVAGAVLALIAFALFARSRKRRPNDISNIVYQKTPQAKSSGDFESKSTSVIPLVDIPIECADDSQIKKSLMDLNELINQHVENHYHNHAFVGQPADLERELSKCGFNKGGSESAAYMTSVLIDPRTRGAGIRKLIAYVILGHSQPNSPESLSLLPGSISGLSRAMLQVRRRPGEEQGKFPKLGAHQVNTNLTFFPQLLKPLSQNGVNSVLSSSNRQTVAMELIPTTTSNLLFLRTYYCLTKSSNPSSTKGRMLNDNKQTISPQLYLRVQMQLYSFSRNRPNRYLGGLRRVILQERMLWWSSLLLQRCQVSEGHFTSYDGAALKIEVTRVESVCRRS